MAVNNFNMAVNNFNLTSANTFDEFLRQTEFKNLECSVCFETYEVEKRKDGKSKLPTPTCLAHDVCMDCFTDIKSTPHCPICRIPFKLSAIDLKSPQVDIKTLKNITNMRTCWKQIEKLKKDLTQSTLAAPQEKRAKSVASKAVAATQAVKTEIKPQIIYPSSYQSYATEIVDVYKELIVPKLSRIVKTMKWDEKEFNAEIKNNIYDWLCLVDNNTNHSKGIARIERGDWYNS